MTVSSSMVAAGVGPRVRADGEVRPKGRLPCRGGIYRAGQRAGGCCDGGRLLPDAACGGVDGRRRDRCVQFRALTVDFAAASTALTSIAPHDDSHWSRMLPAGFAEYLRFAAAELVPPELKARAVSLTIASSVISAVVGPQVAVHFQHCSYMQSLCYAPLSV